MYLHFFTSIAFSSAVSLTLLSACAQAQTAPKLPIRPISPSLLGPTADPDQPVIMDVRVKQTEKGSPLALPEGNYILELRRGSDAESFDAVLNTKQSQAFDQRLRLRLNGCKVDGLQFPQTVEAFSRSLPGRPLANAFSLIVPISSGGSDCTLSGTSTMASQTAQLYDGPDECCPAGEETQRPPGELPDLYPKSVTIAGTKIRWARTLTLDAAKAESRNQGRCAFPYSYLTSNQGLAASGATENRVRLNLAIGAQLDSHPLPGLAPGGSYTHNGYIQLPSGNWTVWFNADDIEAVTESFDGNNQRAVTVQVQGSCN